jgi:DDB1- and CUL4-associated factor 4
VILSPPRRLACDIWTSHLRDRRLVLGGDNLPVVPLESSQVIPGVRQRALLIQDVENLGDIGRLETQSDVFALHQEEVHRLFHLVKSSTSDFDINQNLVYTGSRSGIIRRFDTRTRAPGFNILGDVFAKSNNSITYLNIIQDWRLLVSTIRGAVRFSWTPPPPERLT